MPESIIEAVAATAVSTPDKFCIADVKNEYTYGEFYSKVCGAARKLLDMGIKKGDMVVIKNLQNCMHMVIHFAVQLIGAVSVPTEKVCADERVIEIASVTEAVLYIGDKEIEFDSRTKYVSVKEFEGLESEQGDIKFPEKDTLSTIMFTTGTTGKSKGIEITHANDIAIAENVMNGVGSSSDTVELIPMPLNHSFGLRRLYGDMLAKAAVCLMDGIVFIKRFYSMMDKYGVNALAIAPAALSIIFKLSGDKISEYKDKLEYVQLGSAPISESDKKHLCELLPNSRLYNFYGTSEAGVSCILNFNSPDDKKHCIGKPCVNATFKIVDENGAEIESSEENTGFIITGGAMCSRAYFKEPELTAETMRDGYIITNDVGYIDKDGFVFVFGRQDDVINSGGNKIAPDEVEEVAAKYDGVEDCACVPMPDPIAGQAPKLFVKAVSGTQLDKEGLYAYLTGSLEGYKVPKVIEEIDEIPRTYNGKLQRKKLINK